MIGLALSLAATLQTSPRLLEIPRPFWGEYNEVLHDCGTGNNDTRLRISWDRLRFYESEGDLRELIRHPDGSVTIAAEHRGEGQTWRTLYNLRLSPDSFRLTVTHAQDGEIEQVESTRFRCPVQGF